MLNIDPLLIFGAIIGGFVPAIVWLLFWLREDIAKPEPARLIIRTFLIGGLSVTLAFILQRAAIPAIEQHTGLIFDLTYPSWSLAFFYSTIPFLLAWALIEELVKYLASTIAVFTNSSFDEPIDAMVYIITASLGFAAVENTLFLVNTIIAGETSTYFILTGNLRFLGATVVHIVSSAIVGATLALTYCSSPRRRIAAFTLGLILASTLHGLFNFFIITSSSSQMFKIFLVLWLAAIFVIYFFERVKRIVCLPDFTVSKTILNR